jgi:hypothetical protein
VRQLLPVALDSVDPSAAYASDVRPRHADRPWLLLDMISSADGATHIDGTSGALGSEGDHVVFRAIRAVADVILVAAGTVRSENYRPVRATDAVREARVARGQAPVARLAILSRHLDFDFDADLFTSDQPPLLLTTNAAPPARCAAPRPSPRSCASMANVSTWSRPCRRWVCGGPPSCSPKGGPPSTGNCTTRASLTNSASHCRHCWSGPPRRG